MGSTMSTDFHAINAVRDSVNPEDRISELPDYIIHDILSRVPFKEATRTTILSKRWRNIWNSFPNIYFDECNFTDSFSYDYDDEQVEKKKSFVDYVDNTLSCRRVNDLNIHKFRLHMTFFDPKLSPTIHEWLNTALEKHVKELDLCMMSPRRRTPSGEDGYCIPQTVFLAKTITSLKLSGCVLRPSEEIKLPSLKSLSLHGIYLNKEILQNLFSGCPELQELNLEQCRLRHFHANNHKIKSITLLNCFGLDTAHVQGSSLQSFTYVGEKRYTRQRLYAECKMKLCAENLVNLTLKGARMVDKSLDDLSGFPFLQNVVLNGCIDIRKMNISGSNLKTVDLEECKELEELEINAPNLEDFKYCGHLISLSSPQALRLEEAMISPYFDIEDMDETAQFMEFISKFSNCKVLKLFCLHDKELTIPAEMRKHWRAPLSELKNLKIHMVMLPMNYDAFMDGLLWMCPNLDVLDVFLELQEVGLKYNIGEARKRQEALGSSSSLESVVSDIKRRLSDLNQLKTQIWRITDVAIPSIREKLQILNEVKMDILRKNGGAVDDIKRKLRALNSLNKEILKTNGNIINDMKQSLHNFIILSS